MPEPGAEREIAGFELPLLLFAGFRSLIDQLHAELIDQGHPDMRPAHGFAMQAIGRSGVTATELGRRLGVSKQAAGKTVDRLEKVGYVQRTYDDADGRRKLIQLTPHGMDALAKSAVIFEQLRARWAEILGPDRQRRLEADLRKVVPDDRFQLDVAGWFGA